MNPCPLRPVLCLAVALAHPAAADVKTYANDSLPMLGGTVACQAGFVTNEIGAAVFSVPPADGRVLLLEAQWWVCDGSGLGLAGPRPMSVQVFGSGGPDPGLPSYASPAVSASPGFLNTWPLEGEGQSFGPGEDFTLGIQLLDGGLFGLFTVLATDVDGCQPGKNLIFAIPGGWTDACSFGVSGDLIVRVKVLTEGPANYGLGTPGTAGLTPVIDAAGPWYEGSSSFAWTAAQAAPGAPGFLGISTAASSLPLFGGTVLVDPFAPGATFTPVVADGAGQAAVATPIPGGATLIGAHVFGQYGFLDGGAAGGVSMSDGLDVKVSSSP